MNNKVLILSDSLGLPRNKPELVTYEDTWPALLKKEGYNVHQVSIGGATSDVLLKQVAYHKEFNPNLVIVQVGIVDCAPRFARKMEIQLLKKIPYLGNRFLNFLNKPSIRKRRRITYTTLGDFKRNILAIKTSFTAPVYFLSIVNAKEEYEAVLSGVKGNIDNYNNVILEIAEDKYISLEGIEDKGVMSDHHHLNEEGHSELFSRIINILNV